MCRNSPKCHLIFWATFVTSIFAQNFQKSPNLVTLTPKYTQEVQPLVAVTVVVVVVVVVLQWMDGWGWYHSFSSCSGCKCEEGLLEKEVRT